MSQLKSVIRFEFGSFAKNKVFVGVTIFLMVLSLVGPLVPAIIGGVSNIMPERSIAVVDHTGLFDQDYLNDWLSPTVSMVTDIEAANQAVIDGNYHYTLVLNHESFTLSTMTMGVGVLNLEHQVASLLRYHYRLATLEGQGISPDFTADVLAFDPVAELVTLGAAGEAGADAFLENVIFAYIMAMVLMFGLQIGGNHILTVVVREKSTKTMELLVTSCKPTVMLLGKVIGTGSALILQIAALALAGIVSMQFVSPAIVGDMEDIMQINIDPMILLYFVVFFLLGYLVFAFIFAALASTCSRQEDAISMGQVPAILLAAGFFMVMIGMNSPGATWVEIASFVPFVSPFVMFLRICMGTATTWEILVSIAIQLASIGLIAWMASKIYRMGTLMYGAKPGFKAILAAFKA